MPERKIEIAGEELVARGDGSLFWPAKRTLFVADVHFGKAAAFRSLAVPVPVGTSARALARLTAALAATGANRLVVLGDLWHAREGATPEILASLKSWRDEHGATGMLLVEGNHDRRAATPPPGFTVVPEPHRDGPFALCHYPCEPDTGYCLAGHIHPAVTLSGKGRQGMRLPCFWFGAHSAVLPAFGEFTGAGDINPAPGDTVLVIADQRLHEVPLKLVRPRAPLSY